MRLPTDGFLLGCTARPLLMVWEVQAGERTAGGVTDDQVAAETAMFDALRTHPTGRGRIRYARLSFIGIGYVYGPTLLTAHRMNGVTMIIAGDAGDAGDAWGGIP
ncbi:hypothetical protein [Spongiactinospora sp. 9N601]|uniref:hypothetical protein n=1 Tax=Spongiactinospora sp. 9N601 TaxID=3375149 RepID=UPI0037B3E277